MKFLRKVSIFLLALTMVFMFTGIVGCGKSATEEKSSEKAVSEKPEENKELTLEERAKEFKGTKVNVYYAYGGWDTIVEEFKKDTDIELVGVDMSSGEALTKMQAEKDNPTMDVWFGGGDDAFRQAAGEGLLEQYESPEASAIPDKYRDKDNYWTGVSLVVVGFSLNKNRLNELGCEAPKTWDDLTDSKWKDEIIGSNPSISGTAYSIVSGIIEMKGEKAGWEYLEALDKNVNHYTPKGSGPGAKVVAGEFTIGLSPGPPEESFQEGSNISFVYPEDGTTWWPAPIALVKNGPNVEAGKIFYDWCLTEHGQEILAKASPRTPTRPGVETPGVIKSIDQIKLLDRDFEWAGAERERIVKEWTNRFGG
ncbi:ABC transporter substrate-binding protein [Candidatus Oleimmundimicrobium sp.]|uniref:ABC transporter substrate-binding protein n=1 Tax=Candidatus Oleimmundimicrobium sp. TaxID=3060597 RepID=UPI002726C1FD|nr:ABC transporter substrate-binding protein [Candidatus Oleimmundimicrobium sp.]MDO8886444.1 ABC transporter substrate-binding protein [Candidatus Oleimmundimicrobium sp.]